MDTNAFLPLVKAAFAQQCSPDDGDCGSGTLCLALLPDLLAEVWKSSGVGEALPAEMSAEALQQRWVDMEWIQSKELVWVDVQQVVEPLGEILADEDGFQVSNDDAAKDGSQMLDDASPTLPDVHVPTSKCMSGALEEAGTDEIENTMRVISQQLLSQDIGKVALPEELQDEEKQQEARRDLSLASILEHAQTQSYMEAQKQT